MRHVKTLTWSGSHHAKEQGAIGLMPGALKIIQEICGSDVVYRIFLMAFGSLGSKIASAR